MMGGGNLLCVGAWIMAKRSGISFINGLEIPEPVQFADGACAALAEVSFLASAAYLLVRAPLPRRPILGGALVVLIAGMGLPGMLAAGRHVHSHGTTVVVGADGKAVETTAAPVVPPHPFDPSLPIDLSGVPGVTPQEQARAENLVAVTLYKLPQWADTKTAIAAGFQSIGDAVTGYEHYINQAYFDDGHVLDPDHPESLVYRVDGDKRILESAMYMLTPGTSLDNVPDIGGPLTQWHIHDNLCFSTSGQVVGLTNPDGSCAPPLVKPEPIPMIHVWIVPRVCGPFAALEGIGGGTVKPGTAVSCDHVHGSGTGF
jgi:hypothetical protein